MEEQKLVRYPRTMKVLANPSAILDEYKQPVCLVPWPGNPERFVGATLDEKKTRETGRFTFIVTDEPVEVPCRGPVGAYFVRKLSEGELLPADDVSKKYAKRGTR